MKEFLKGICTVTIVAGIFGSVVAWSTEQPGPLARSLRFGLPALCLVAFIWFLRIHFRGDRVPDYLYERARKYFDRGGFCFAFSVSAQQGVCILDVLFQNRHERPCVGRVALRPARGWFENRIFDAITLEIPAEPAAFGVARIAVPVPKLCQGAKQRFEVGASVEYPNGKGRMLRFRDGLVIRTNSNFGNAFQTALTVAGALGGAIVLSRPASVTLTFPIGVADSFSDPMAPKVTTLWKLGDPRLR